MRCFDREEKTYCKLLVYFVDQDFICIALPFNLLIEMQYMTVISVSVVYCLSINK